MSKKLILLYFSFFAFHFSFSQTWLWGKCGISWGYANSVAADGQGNCYLSGYYVSEDTINFSDSILVNPPHNPYGESTFLVKYNKSGTIQWARQSINYGNFLYINGGVVSLDNNDNAYIISTYTDTIITGSDTFIFYSTTSSEDYLLAKYSSNGNLRWASSPTLNTTDSSQLVANYVATDIFGNVFVAGLFNSDTVYFGSQFMLGTKYILLPFIVKYDSMGNVLWSRASTVHSVILDNDAEGDCVTTDRNGNAYLTGRFFDSIWFGSYNLITVCPSYEGDVFLVKYSPAGAVLWAKQALLASDFSGCRVVAEICDKSGNVYVAGDFVDTVTFGPYTLIGTGLDQSIGFYQQNNIFLVKYDSIGTVLWAKQGKVLDSNSWGAGTLSIDNYNHIYLTGGGGTYHCKIAFGNDTLSLFDTAYFDGASIILKLDSNGNVLCSTIISGGGGNSTNSISSDTSGKYVYFGSTASTVLSFGNDTINPFEYHSPDFLVYAFPFAARLGECFETVTENPVITNDVGWAEVYPNPNNGNFILSISNFNQKCNVEIYNILGEIIYSETLPQPQNNDINLTGQPNGVYFYRVLKEDGSLFGSGKLVIDK